MMDEKTLKQGFPTFLNRGRLANCTNICGLFSKDIGYHKLRTIIYTKKKSAFIFAPDTQQTTGSSAQFQLARLPCAS